MKLKSKLIKGDLIRVIAGKHKGYEGVITNILRDKGRVSVEGLTNKKTKKATSQDQPSGIIEIPATLHISNVALIDPQLKVITKIGFVIEGNSKKRKAKRSKVILPT
jgi:large subunit ribosomal protein L24